MNQPLDLDAIQAQLNHPRWTPTHTVVDQLLAEARRLEAELRRERAAHHSTIADRDRASDYADRLADRIAPFDVTGEHSAGNCPWQNALDYDGPRPA
ncbi:hypothetical protein ACPC54_17845 [Kitasatospora sp. NPDC094028]